MTLSLGNSITLQSRPPNQSFSTEISQSGTGAAILADPRFSVPKGSGENGNLVNFEEHAGGSWTGPDDHTSAVRVVYDDDNIYFGFVVTDEYHENSANSAWNGDSVQLMVANAERDTQVALYNYALARS